MTRKMISLGIDRFVAQPPDWIRNKNIGLLCNQASTDRNYQHSRHLIEQILPGQLTCLFSPQHGFFSEKQDNMVESRHSMDPTTGLPIFSLYGDSRKPDSSMMDHLDVLLVDLFDVGTRVYTFFSTLVYCLEAAAEHGKKVVVLDRPNPLGGKVIEGNLLKSEWQSFVGLYPLPMRHGLTLGELALFVKEQAGLDLDLEVVSVAGLQRSMLFPQTGLPWVFPSPNIPGPATALVYPGQVIWEGTNISEGRGTTLPFEIFGAPFIDPAAIAGRLANFPLPGCALRPLVFEPTANKWANKACQGFQLHVLDAETFLPYRTSLALLQAVMALYPDDFQFKSPPYEYEYDGLPMDFILGDEQLRLKLEQGADILELETEWQGELAEFDALRSRFFLYDG